MPKRSARRPDPRDLVAEIIRRTGKSQHGPTYVVRLSDPPTSFERLQLMSARLQRTPIAIMPVKCDTMDEWLQRYSRFFHRCPPLS